MFSVSSFRSIGSVSYLVLIPNLVKFTASSTVIGANYVLTSIENSGIKK